MNVMKRRSTIFSCTALFLGPYGISFSLWLVSSGCSPSQFRRERNRIVFREGSIDFQRLKNFFVYNLWNWNKLYLGGEVITLLGFLELLASN